MDDINLLAISYATLGLMHSPLRDDPKIVIIFHKHLQHKNTTKNSNNQNFCMLLLKLAEHHVHFKFKLEINLCKPN